MANEGKPKERDARKVAEPQPVKPSKSRELKNTPKKVPVKKPAAKKRAKRAAPKKPVITEKDFEAWYFGHDIKYFVKLSQLWNEANLQIQIPNHDGYDEWLNYFKGLSPTIIKQLAVTGVDFLPTDGYAALSRWHDIISHPHRIDKIHQAGLTGKPKDKGTKTIVELAHDNDRMGVLKAVRDEIATKLQKGAGARDTAALSREMTEIMTQIADYEKRQGPKKTTKLGALLGDVDLRTKRPPKNGGGSRNTSYKSRVTIKDVEGQ